MRKKQLDELEKIAAKATRDALMQYEIPESIHENLVRGIAFDGDDRIFELYIAGERPEDAQVISAVRVNSITGEVIAVEVFDVLKKKPERPESPGST